MKARMPKAERHISKKEIRILCDMIIMTAHMTESKEDLNHMAFIKAK